MNIVDLHNWNVTPTDARIIQKNLRQRITLTWTPRSIKYITGLDAHYLPKREKILACGVTLSYPDLKLLEVKTTIKEVTFPYIPGLLAFREGPSLLELLSRQEIEADVYMFDGQGIAHPQRMGIATHIGLFINKPTIGCAKNLLVGKFDLPANKKGSYTYIIENREKLGVVLRTKTNVKPIFVSCGNLINLKKSIEITIKCCTHYRIPEPLRLAHIYAKRGLKYLL
jgi:deoxyribonuclease V